MKSPGALSGTAVVYGAKDDIAGMFKEVWLPRAFKKSLARGGYRGDVMALWSHDMSQPLGRRSAGTLTINDRTEGLDFTVDLPDTQVGRDARTSVLRGDVNGMSFAFQVVEGGDKWSREDGWDLRVVHEAELIEVSPVSIPAFRATSVGVSRSAPTAELLRTKRHAIQAAEVYADLRDDPRVRDRHRSTALPSRRTVPAILTVR